MQNLTRRNQLAAAIALAVIGSGATDRRKPQPSQKRFNMIPARETFDGVWPFKARHSAAPCFAAAFPKAPIPRLERAGEFPCEDEPTAIVTGVDRFIRLT